MIPSDRTRFLNITHAPGSDEYERRMAILEQSGCNTEDMIQLVSFLTDKRGKCHGGNPKIQKQVTSMYENMRWHSIHQDKPTPEFSSTYDFKSYLYYSIESQRFRCAVSRKPLDPFKISPEKVDSFGYYSKDNIIFIHVDFQSIGSKGDECFPAQWTSEKFEAVKMMREDSVSVDLRPIQDAFSYDPDKTRKVWARKTRDCKFRGVSLTMNECDRIAVERGEKWTPFASMTKAGKELGTSDANIAYACKRFDEDESIVLSGGYQFMQEEYKPKQHANPEYLFFSRMLSRARQNNSQRKKNGRDLDFSISVWFLLNQFIKQKGLCAYLDIPMSLKPKSQFMCTCERIDRDVGYVPGNVLLVCHEVNPTCSQWSREKASLYFRTKHKSTRSPRQQ